jgi:hypothetical protein
VRVKILENYEPAVSHRELSLQGRLKKMMRGLNRGNDPNTEKVHGETKRVVQATAMLCLCPCRDADAVAVTLLGPSYITVKS